MTVPAPYPTWELRPGGGWQSVEQCDDVPDVAIYKADGQGWFRKWRTSATPDWFETVLEAKIDVARTVARR